MRQSSFTLVICNFRMQKQGSHEDLKVAISNLKFQIENSNPISNFKSEISN